MIKNNIRTATRNLLKNKGFTFINISGLALGLATFILILIYVVDELSYDRYNTKADRIYRLNTDIKFGGNASSLAISSPPMAAELMAKLPEVEQATRLLPAVDIRYKKGNENVHETKTAYADANFFSVFTMPLLEGDAATALKEPHTVALSASAAQKYFGSTRVVGRFLTLVNTNEPYKVTGVMADMPQQSHFSFDYLMSMASMPNSNAQNWNSFAYNTYVLFKHPVNVKSVEQKLNKLVQQHFGVAKYKKFAQGGNYIRAGIIPLTDIHLQSNRQYELGANSSAQYVYIFSAIALFVLIIACINFMNLSTARSANRAREVGVRKVLGSSRQALIVQFLSESLLITLAASVLALLAAWALLPLFNQLSGKELGMGWAMLGWVLPTVLAIVLVVGLLAGAYPAFYLSAFQPAGVLKGKVATGFKNSGLRNFLVVFQFATSIFLIVGTLVIYNQLHYIQHKDLGYNRNQVMVIKNVNSLENTQVLKDRILQLPEVKSATLSGFLPTGTLRQPNSVFTDRAADAKSAVFTEIWPVDADYLRTMDMRLINGRNFSTQMPTDSNCVIINQAAARLMGISKNPIHQKIYNVADDGEKKQYTIIGVLQDFNFASLRDNITPVTMFLQPSNGALSLKFSTVATKTLIAKVANVWNSLAPSQQLEYSFMDQDFDAAYKAENRTGGLFLAFTTLAIMIACLGLFSLAAYAAEQRVKEIGIRKILGATVGSISAMLSKDFIKLVTLAMVLATPLAWYTMHQWLNGFAYRQEIQWWVPALAGVLAVAIALLTISFQCVKAALTNPVESLRSE